MSYGYGSSDHDHRDLEHRLEQKIDEARWDAQRDLRELEDRMNAMRAELSDWIRTEIEGLSEWIRDHGVHHSHEEFAAKDGRS